jgi:hypothetical protein
MPTFTEYLTAAERLRHQSRRLAHEALVLSARRADRIGLTGPAGDHHDDLLGSLHRTLMDAVHELDEVVEVCARRASVCRTYAEELWRWRRLGLAERLEAPVPRRPAAWVDT